MKVLDYVENERRWLYLFLVRPEDMERVVTSDVSEQQYWEVDVLRSPVVQFNRSFSNGAILRSGRLYYVDGYYGEDGVWLEKDSAFRGWAKRTLATAKKFLRRCERDYVGPDTLKWLQEGGELTPR